MASALRPALSLLCCMAAAGPAAAEPLAAFAGSVSAAGEISLPEADFRTEWTLLGAWSVAGDDGAAGLHLVYTPPEAVAAYRETGAFPDGAVLVKELLSTATEDMTTGRVSRAQAVEGRFVMVKDTLGRFPDNPLWGDGWGWAHFAADAPSTLVTTSYEAECQACHVPAQATDWVYVQGYPVLRLER